MTTFVKERRDAPEGFYEAEAAGLCWRDARQGKQPGGVGWSLITSESRRSALQVTSGALSRHV
jgi:hypothetical protein